MKITLKKVTKKYGKTVAVADFSTELPSGHLICLLGPSGCGKSTLLNMISGIVDVTEGQIFFDDKDVTKLPPDLRNIGMVFQNYALYPHMTVLDNISFPLEMEKMTRAERHEKAKEIAKLVHVDTLLKRYPGELSGGQQQRVAIARALVKNPEILLMDEPLSNLDARLRLEMREEIRRIQQETGITTIFVTHDQEEAMSISDSIILMKDGFFIQGGLSQQLYDQPVNQFVADFLGNPPINTIRGGEVQSEKNLIYSLNGAKVPLPETAFKNQKQSAPAILSVRAESFDLIEKGESKEKAFPAVVSRISLLGKEQIVYVKLLSEEGNAVTDELRAILSTDRVLRAGEKIDLKLKNKGVFLFVPESGERL